MDNLIVYGHEYNGIEAIKATDNNGNLIQFVNGCTIDEYAEGSYPSGDIDLTGVVTSDYAFAGCSNITSVTGELGQNSLVNGLFNDCTGITTAHIVMSNAAKGTGGIFQRCTNLTTAVLLTNLNAANSNQGTFNGCTKLEVADLRLSTLPNNVFYNCSALETIILRNSTAICAMGSVGALSSTAKFKSGGTGGTIYIPKALYDELGTGSSLDYKAASNWSTFEGYGTITWAQIEGSYYETHYADGTLISS